MGEVSGVVTSAGADRGRYALNPGLRVLLADLRISPARVLRRAGLPADLLARGPIDLPAEHFFAFWQAMDDEGAGRDLAVEIGRVISVELFHPPIFAALCSPNLAIAAERIATYKPLIGPMRLHVTVDRPMSSERPMSSAKPSSNVVRRGSAARGLTIAYQWPAGPTPPNLLVTAELVFWVALARLATRHQVHPVKVALPRIPRERTGLEQYLGTHVRAGRTPSLTFTASDATRPFLTENEGMWHYFAPELRRRLSDVQASATLAERVRAALHEALPVGDPSITAVTRQLSLSSRTLQRQLRDEGTTFQEVLTTTREGLARHYLQQPELRAADIAYLLGYSDTNSFYRAFRSWTGTTPAITRIEAR